jgi:hypothetical protein
MGFEVFRSAGAPYKRPESHLGDLVPYPDSSTAYPGQLGIDWTPAARELGMALRKRESKAAQILARLRQGPAGTAEMARIGGIRFGARVLELRRKGHNIKTEEHADHAIYTLEEGA